MITKVAAVSLLLGLAGCGAPGSAESPPPESQSAAQVTELTCDGEPPVSKPLGSGDRGSGADSPRAAALTVVRADEEFSLAQERETSAVAFVLRADGTAYKRYGLVALADDTWHVEFVEACSPDDL